MGGKQLVRVIFQLRIFGGRLLRIFLFYALRCIPLNPNKVVFCVFHGNGYGDNPKYIAEEIIRQNLDYDLVWLLRNGKLSNDNLPLRIRPVRFGSLKAVYELATARVWVDNHLQSVYVRKRKGQLYIQTSHGLPFLKNMEYDAYTELSIIEAKMIDIYLSNSSWASSVIVKDFRYHGEILECGVPRNDIFFGTGASINKRVRERFNIRPDQKIVLYAPTWRPDYDLSNYTFETDMCLESLRKRFPGDWVLMVRHHPAVHDRSLGISGSARYIDASHYEDIQELLAVIDIVVTDYSSLMFDFAIRRLPVFLYTPDINAYRKERGLCFDEDELPFSFATNNAQLASIIAKFDESLYVEHVNNFFASIGTCDNGSASQTVVHRIRAHSA